MTVEMKQGAYYRRRDGALVGPAEYVDGLVFPWRVSGVYYTSSGRSLTNGNEPSHLDLVELVSYKEAPDDERLHQSGACGACGRPTKRETLEKAIDAVADRGLNYGSPEDNFNRIARRWQLHFLNRYGIEVTVDAHDVAQMMVDMKLARLENQPRHEDSWVDIAGYAACGNNLP